MIKKLKQSNLKYISFSSPRFIVFILIFAALGGYVIYRSFAVGVVGTADYYISPGGSNSNPGSQSQPFATFDKCYQTADISSTDKICEYSGTFTTAGVCDILPSASKETATHHVIFRPPAGQTPVFNDGTNYIGCTIKGDHILWNGPFEVGSLNIAAATSTDKPEDVTVDGISKMQTTVYYALNFTGSSDATYKNIFSNGQGILCGGGSRPAQGPNSTTGPFTNSYITYENIHWYGCSKPSHFADCLHEYNEGTDSMTVKGNWFEWCESYGILFDDTTSHYTSCSNQPPSLIENNRFGNLNNSPISLMNPTDRNIWNVTVQFNSMEGGITLPSSAPTGSFCNVVLRGNVRTVYSGIHCNLWPGVTAEYNVTYRDTAGIGCAYTGQGNKYIGVTPASALWPNFTSGDFSISPSSPLYAKATGASSFPSIDYAGNARPGTDGTIDAGAYEYTSGVSPPPSNSPPTVSLSANPTTITSGSSSTLTWSSSNASSCSASGAWTGSKPIPSGSQVVSPTTNSTYNLDCSGPGGSTSKIATITVNPTNSPPPTNPPPPNPPPSPTYKSGDLNHDNLVNIFDLSILLTNYSTSNATADINVSGKVDVIDLSILLTNYGT